MPNIQLWVKLPSQQLASNTCKILRLPVRHFSIFPAGAPGKWKSREKLSEKTEENILIRKLTYAAALVCMCVCVCEWVRNQ